MLKQFEIDGCYDSYIHDNKNRVTIQLIKCHERKFKTQKIP